MGSLFTLKQKGSTRNPLRGLSHDNWHQSEIEQILVGNLDAGIGFIEDFTSAAQVDNWVKTNIGASSSTFALTDEIGGVVDLDGVSGTVNLGSNLERADGTLGEMFQASVDSDLYFETRIKLDVNGKLFVGLSVKDTGIISGGSNSSANHIGFEAVGTDGVVSAVTEAAGTRSSQASGVHTIVADDWVKLGFRTYGTDKVEFFVNGKVVATLTSNIPTELMLPILAVTSDGSSGGPVMSIDWVAVSHEQQILN